MSLQEYSGLDIAGTATRTVPLLRAIRPGRLVGASIRVETAPDGTKTVKIRNNTRGVDMTAALTVSGLAALAGAAFVVNTDGSADYTIGDSIDLVYTVTVAGTVGLGCAAVAMDCNEGVGYEGGGIGG
jgi:hypothetical protein